MTADEKNVIAAVQRMTHAFHEGDIEGVMSSYEPRATVVFEPGEPVSDPARIRQMFQGMFPMNPRFEYSGHEVYVAGDTATHFAPWSMTAAAPDGSAIAQRGLSVAILRRQADGRWLMVIDNPHGQRLLES